MLFWPAQTLRSDNFIFYFPTARHAVPVEVIEHAKYLPLLPVLNLVGKVSGLQEKRASLKVWFGNTPLEVRRDDKKVRLNKISLPLSDPVRISNGQWVVPVDFLTTVLPKLTHEPIEYQLGTNRIFIGDVRPGSFTVRLDPLTNGARLTVQFTDKVAVRTAARDGKWVMFLGDRPIEPLEQAFRFQDPYISDLRFDDQDGVPKLILTPTSGGLNFYPSLAEGGKILLADVLKPPAPMAPMPPPSPPSTSTTAPVSGPPAGAEEVPAAAPGPPLPVVILDAGHGGDDPGARSRDGVLEKDLVAQLVARVRLALLSTQKYRIVLTRVGDTDRSFEQRETAANLARPAIFLTFHAGPLGSVTPRVAVYAYRPPSAPAAPNEASDQPRPLFVPWTEVQQVYVEESWQLAQALEQQFTHIPGVTVDKPSQAPVRALRSVDAAAVAIEMGSLSPATDSGPLTKPDFQQQIAAAIVKALDGFPRRPH